MHLIPDAFAQSAAGGAAGATNPTVAMLIQFGYFIPIIVIFYLLLIRPQQRKAKEHQETLKKIAKGDTVITAGGLIGKVVKIVDDNELQVEVGENVKVRILRSGVSDVRAKGEPVKAETK